MTLLINSIWHYNYNLLLADCRVKIDEFFVAEFLILISVERFEQCVYLIVVVIKLFP